jgi:hypothetical protein
MALYVGPLYSSIPESQDWQDNPLITGGSLGWYSDWAHTLLHALFRKAFDVLASYIPASLVGLLVSTLIEHTLSGICWR